MTLRASLETMAQSATPPQQAPPAGGARGAAPAIPKMEAGNPAQASSPDVSDRVREAVQNAVNQAREAREAAIAAARDAAQGATPGQPQVLVPPPINPRDMIPPQAVDIATVFFLTVAFCIVGFPLARAFARRIDRRTERMQVGGEDVGAKLHQLQESVDALAIELERISEAQRFQSRLLAEKAGASPAGTARQ